MHDRFNHPLSIAPDLFDRTSSSTDFSTLCNKGLARNKIAIT
ncbi:hypothetical protein NIES2104_47200 [Leptolyngbya sp. NIES-2104]|nr:hypothetical protein NIES2104_47200 [Leptolyngbya sp. NIES-2104]